VGNRITNMIGLDFIVSEANETISEPWVEICLNRDIGIQLTPIFDEETIMKYDYSIDWQKLCDAGF